MKVKVVALPGDGVGPEVMDEALKALKALMSSRELELDVRTFKSGWMHFSGTGRLWEDGAFEACRDWADAVLHGAVGWPGARPKGWSPADGSVVMDLRYGLELFANVRPVRLIEGVPIMLGGKEHKVWGPDHVDMTVVRENLECLYQNARRTPFPDETVDVQVDERHISRMGATRIIKYAYREATIRARRRMREWDQADAALEDPLPDRPSVTCVDKSNVLPSCALFRQVFDQIAAINPGIRASRYYADAFQLAMLQDPSRFDVVVTTNLIGDLLTDLAALLQGGLGMAPSANIGKDKAMFEPVHGSAPDIAGKGIANPTGMILSAAMMLEWLSRRTGDMEIYMAYELLERAVSRHYLHGGPRTPDLGGDASTVEVGDSVVSYLK